MTTIDGHSRDDLHRPQDGLPFADLHATEAAISRLRQEAFDKFIADHAASDALPTDEQQSARDAANQCYTNRMAEIDTTMNNRETYEGVVDRHLDSIDNLPAS